MTTRLIAILLLLWPVVTSCGKYGPPRRVHRTPEPTTQQPEPAQTQPEADSEKEEEQQP